MEMLDELSSSMPMLKLLPEVPEIVVGVLMPISQIVGSVVLVSL